MKTMKLASTGTEERRKPTVPKPKEMRTVCQSGGRISVVGCIHWFAFENEQQIYIFDGRGRSRVAG